MISEMSYFRLFIQSRMKTKSQGDAVSEPDTKIQKTVKCELKGEIFPIRPTPPLSDASETTVALGVYRRFKGQADTEAHLRAWMSGRRIHPDPA